MLARARVLLRAGPPGEFWVGREGRPFCLLELRDALGQWPRRRSPLCWADQGDTEPGAARVKALGQREMRAAKVSHHGWNSELSGSGGPETLGL